MVSSRIILWLINCFSPISGIKYWTEAVISYVPKGCRYVSGFVPNLRYPKVYVVEENKYDKIRELMGAPNWVKAITKEDEIYILFGPENKRWKRILNHELFHAMVYIYLQSDKRIPAWFNEAIAYYVGKNYDVDPQMIAKYLEPHFPEIVEAVLADTVLDIDFYGCAVVKYIGRYLCVKYGKRKVKALIIAIKDGLTFEQAFKTIFGLNVEEVIKNWYYEEFGKR
jgi:hypothetical protein